MRRAFFWLVSPVTLVWAAFAIADNSDGHSRLKGEYAFTGTAACLVAPGSTSPATPTNPTPGISLPNAGFTANLQPVDGKVFSFSSSVEGIQTFNGDGTGTVNGTVVSISVPPTPGPAGSGYPSFPPSASSNTFSASFTSKALADDTFTVVFVPGSFLGTFLTGPRTGQTYTIDNPPLTGLIGKDKKMLTLASVEPTIEIQTHSNGDVWPRICHRSRVLIKLGKSDRD